MEILGEICGNCRLLSTDPAGGPDWLCPEPGQECLLVLGRHRRDDVHQPRGGVQLVLGAQPLLDGVEVDISALARGGQQLPHDVPHASRQALLAGKVRRS